MRINGSGDVFVTPESSTRTWEELGRYSAPYTTRERSLMTFLNTTNHVLIIGSLPPGVRHT
jgi:hypothetical protein